MTAKKLYGKAGLFINRPAFVVFINCDASHRSVKNRGSRYKNVYLPIISLPSGKGITTSVFSII